MKASEYIAALQALIIEHGDLECKSRGFTHVLGASMPTIPPEAAFQAVLGKRERLERFAVLSSDTKGEKVFKI